MRTFTVSFNDKLKRVIILLSSQYKLFFKKIELYDGPDDQGLKIKPKNKNVFSTFQCYLKLYAENFTHESQSIRISSTTQKLSQNIVVDLYNASYHTLNMSARGHNHLHYIGNFTCLNGFINISLISFNYNGPEIKRCRYGGMFYYEPDVDRYRKDVVRMCSTYRKTPGSKSFDRFPMDFVTSASNVLIMIYSYHPYNEIMEVKIHISVTPCKGVIPCEGELNMLIFTKL